MEAVEAHASGISNGCRLLLEVQEVGRAVIEEVKGLGGPSMPEREQTVRDLVGCHRVVSGRMIELLTRLQAALHDLATNVADSKAGIEKRRALMLAKDLVEFRPRTDKPVRGIR
jgi:hypothetical protein